MIIAIDFDGTCVTHDYPKIGQDIGAVPVLRALVEQGHKLILWTMRDKQELLDAINWFKHHEIELWGINNNPDQKHWTSSRKVYAHIYIDDCALGVPLVTGKHERDYVDWEKIIEIL